MSKTLVFLKQSLRLLEPYKARYYISNALQPPKFNLASSIRTMSSTSTIPLVDIDPSGVFKYILINVYDKAKNEAEPQMVIVRGYKRCDYHSDIFDEVQAKLLPLDLEPLGGGRISHDPENKKIHIYGYSQGYGKADHEVTAKLVKDAYSGYAISISDEGY